MIPLKFSYENLDLAIFPSFEEKLDAVVAYFEIIAVFCELREGEKIEIPSPFGNTYHVIKVLIQGGDPPSIKSLLQRYLEILQDSLDDYVYNHEDYHTILMTLEKTREKCILWDKKNDPYRSLSSDTNEISFLTINGDHWYKLFFDQTVFAPNAQKYLADQFSLRREFFEELSERISKKITSHLEIPPFPQKPYKWNSDKPHLEIAELLMSLIQTRIIIKDGKKGSYSKLAKEFYNLFGLDDGPYHQKRQEINGRKKKKTWLHELPKALLGKETETS